MAGGTRVSTTQTGPWGGYIGDPEFKGSKSWGQQPYLIGGMEQARSLYDMYGGMGPSYYGGQTLAGFTPAERMGQRAVTNYATGARTGAQQAAAEKALIGGLGGQVDYSQFQPMADVYGQQYLSEIQKNMPAVRQAMVEYQPGGGSRGDIVQGQIASAAGKNLAQNLAGLYGGAYSAAQERVPQFANLYPSIMGAPMEMYGALGGVGEQQRAMQQEAINRDMARYQYESTAPQAALQNYMAMVSGDYGAASRQTTPGPGMMGTLGSLASIIGPGGLGLFGSDIRIKENIVPDGTTYNGHNVYHFNYINDDVRRRGVMAQEVELTNPDAVVEIDGIKHVNYEAL